MKNEINEEIKKRISEHLEEIFFLGTSAVRQFESHVYSFNIFQSKGFDVKVSPLCVHNTLSYGKYVQKKKSKMDERTKRFKRRQTYVSIQSDPYNCNC